MMRVAAMAAKASLTPTRLYLVRHGQVADGHTDRYHGNNDIGLSDKGVRQFEDLTAQLVFSFPSRAWEPPFSRQAKLGKHFVSKYNLGTS